MDVVAGAVGQGLLDEVAAVGGGVHRNVPGPAAHAALKDGFQGGKVVVVGGEAQVIDEEDELEGVGRQLIHQVGDLVELVLLDLHQPQAVGGILIGNGLDRAGFAGACIAVEQNIVGGGTGQQGAGVGNDLFPLLLVARQLTELLGVGVLHGHQPAVLHREHMVLGKHAVALLPGFPHPLVVGGGQVELPCLPTGQERQLPALPVSGFQQRVQRQAAELLQKVQLTVQGGLHHRGELACGGLPHTEGLGLQHGVGKIITQIGGVGKQGSFKGGHSIAQGGDGIVSRFQPVGQRRQLCHNRVAQQGTENNKPVEPGVPFTKLHHQTLLLTGPLRHFSPASPVRGAGQADGEVFTRLYTQRRLSARVCSIIFIFRLIHFTNRRLTKARFIV